jgi:hypothetical protein
MVAHATKRQEIKRRTTGFPFPQAGHLGFGLRESFSRNRR